MTIKNQDGRPKIVDLPGQTEPDSVFGAQCIFDRTAEGVARVWVIVFPERVAVTKMRLVNGRTRVTTTWYHQRPAAINYAKRWIEERIAILTGPAKEAS